MIWEVFTVVNRESDKTEEEEELEEKELEIPGKSNNRKSLNNSKKLVERDDFTQSNSLNKRFSAFMDLDPKNKVVLQRDILRTSLDYEENIIEIQSDTNFQNLDLEEKPKRKLKIKRDSCKNNITISEDLYLAGEKNEILGRNISKNDYIPVNHEFKNYKTFSKLLKNPFLPEILTKTKIVLASSYFVPEKLIDSEPSIVFSTSIKSNLSIESSETKYSKKKIKSRRSSKRNSSYINKVQEIQEKIGIYQEKFKTLDNFLKNRDSFKFKLLRNDHPTNINKLIMSMIQDLEKQLFVGKNKNVKESQTQKSILQQAILKNSDKNKMNVKYYTILIF